MTTDDKDLLIMTQEQYDDLPRIEKLAAQMELNDGTARIVPETGG